VLRQRVDDAQHGLLIVQVLAGLEVECRQHGRVNVDELDGRMLREQMAAAELAPLARALRRFVECADVLGARRDLHGTGAP
jgi:hypothetical protein